MSNMQPLDTVWMSLSAIRANKLRSTLTLVGIIAGVASIIAVMTAISVVQVAMEKEMSVLGSQTFQAQKWPAGGFNSEQERRKAARRPPLTVEQANAVREQVTSADMVGAELWKFGVKVRFSGETSNANVSIVGGTPEYSENNTHYIGLGRNISQRDVASSQRVAVIGFGLANRLFPFIDPIGHDIYVDDRKFRLIGVFDEKKSAFGSQYDNYVLIPISYYQRMYGQLGNGGFMNSVNITVRSRTPELLPDAMEETRQVLRRVRGLKPHEEDNFEFFNSASLIDNFNQTTLGVKIGAFVMGTISLLVAGIGIMNIMLVSVTERTKEIGIRKSLGAKRLDILRQFLWEAIILCNIGGILGVALGFGLGNIMSAMTEFEASVPLEWAAVGVLFCSVVGVGFGLLPAIKASKLDPIEALRFE